MPHDTGPESMAQDHVHETEDEAEAIPGVWLPKRSAEEWAEVGQQLGRLSLRFRDLAKAAYFLGFNPDQVEAAIRMLSEEEE